MWKRFSVFTLFSAKKSLTTARPVCWGIVVKETPTVVSPFWGRFLLTAFLRRRRISVHISLFTATIRVNYTSEFQELFETTAYEVDHMCTKFRLVQNWTSAEPLGT